MPRELAGLRVLVVGNWPPPLGGVSVHVRALSNAAEKAGAHVTVLDVGEGQHESERVVPSGREVRFAVSLAVLAARSDVVHLHTSGANHKSWMLVAAVGLAARAAGRPSIVTFHSGHAPRWLSTTARAVAARAALALYTRVVCVNEEISRSLTRLGAAERRHVVAPAFGREGVVAGAVPDVVERLRESGRRVVSAMLAPGEDYGARELFEAFASVRRSKRRLSLVVYGPGTEGRATAALADACGVKVTALGQIERSEALAVVRASELFVRPTRVDGDAVSVREALALGTRVVATRVGTRPAGVRLCEPQNPKDLARAMKEALDEQGEPLQAVPGQDGVETVLSLYARLANVRARVAA